MQNAAWIALRLGVAVPRGAANLATRSRCHAFSSAVCRTTSRAVAARAAAGDRGAAVKAAEEALRLARERGKTLLADSVEARLERYRAGGGG
jgi:hypothetical protein